MSPNPESVKLNKTTLTVGVGKTDSSVTASILPAGANQEITVTSKDAETATVAGLKITGAKAGSTVVTVSSKELPTIKAEIAVTVIAE